MQTVGACLMRLTQGFKQAKYSYALAEETSGGIQRRRISGKHAGIDVSSKGDLVSLFRTPTLPFSNGCTRSKASTGPGTSETFTVLG